MDKNKRQAIIHEMQKMIYDDCPYIILAYGPELEAYRTDRFEGWVRTPENGTVIMTHSMATYENIKPLAQTQEPAQEETGAAGSGKSSSWLWIVILIIAAAGIAVTMRRKKNREI